MPRSLTALLLPALALVTLAARAPDDPKHENHFAPVGAPASDVVSFQVGTAHAQSQFVLVETKITNVTSDRLVILKKGEARFVLPNGTFPTTKGGIGALFGDRLLIQPGDTKSFPYKAEGDGGFHVDTATLQLDGFSLAPNTGRPVAAPEFALPAARNDLAAGPFACKLLKVKQETKETAAQFSCTYSGKGIGYVTPERIGVKAPGGQEYANDARKAAREILFPGDTAKFEVAFHIPAKVVDMQFATLQVLFRDALSEAEVTPLKLGDWRFDLDPAKTAAANE